MTPPPPASWRRFRRLRRTSAIRSLVCETRLVCEDLILPLFINEGIRERREIRSMPGVWNHPPESIPALLEQAQQVGIKAVLLFGITERKDGRGTSSLEPAGVLARMIRAARAAAPDLVLIADICFCEYTDHGHCGVLAGDDVDNDATLELLQRQALLAAESGADFVAPSAMMDGQVAAIRTTLDTSDLSHVGILAYSSKFASCFYGPFREAVASTFKGTRRTYQMQIGNCREALEESLEDARQGADLLMVKPALAYLDVIALLRQQTRLPVVAYQVSGEYAMIKFASQAGALDERSAVMETLTAIKRAGADLIISYFALEVASWLRS